MSGWFSNQDKLKLIQCLQKLNLSLGTYFRAFAASKSLFSWKGLEELRIYNIITHFAPKMHLSIVEMEGPLYCAHIFNTEIYHMWGKWAWGKCGLLSKMRTISAIWSSIEDLFASPACTWHLHSKLSVLATPQLAWPVENTSTDIQCISSRLIWLLS